MHSGNDHLVSVHKGLTSNLHLITTEAVAGGGVFSGITQGVLQRSEEAESKQGVILPEKQGSKCHSSPLGALRMFTR